jgi:hypothetical protein
VRGGRVDYNLKIVRFAEDDPLGKTFPVEEEIRCKGETSIVFLGVD